MKKLVSIIVVIFLSCEVSMDNRFLIDIQNNSDSTLKFHVASENSVLMYPDTLLPARLDDLGLSNITGSVLWGNSENWEDRIKSFGSDTLSIYFFHPDTLEMYPWEEIRDNYKVLKRYDLSIDDLKLLDFKVEYPPSEKMQNIKMYPKQE